MRFVQLMVLGMLVASVETASADEPTWAVLRISRVQVEPARVDGSSWDPKNAASPSPCGIVAAVAGSVATPIAGAVASFLCTLATSKPDTDQTAPDVFVEVVAGDSRYRTPIASNRFAEAFTTSIVVPIGAIPAAGLELQVLDADGADAKGELIGLARLTKQMVLDAVTKNEPIVTLSDSQVRKLEVEVTTYSPPSPASLSIDYDVSKSTSSLALTARAGELVTIAASGRYSVANNGEQLDENGYVANVKRGYNQRDFAGMNHAAAIAMIGTATENHTAIMVRSCVILVTPTNGRISVGVNDTALGNNRGTIRFTAKVSLPSIEQWKSGGVAACTQPSAAEVTTASNVPEGLDRSMIEAGVGNVKSTVMSCATSASKGVVVKVSVSVASDGRVSSASQVGADEALGNCVIAALKGAVFPATKSGGRFTVPFTF